MGIRSRLYRAGANVAEAVASSRTVGRSTGATRVARTLAPQGRRAVSMGRASAWSPAIRDARRVAAGGAIPGFGSANASRVARINDSMISGAIPRARAGRASMVNMGESGARRTARRVSSTVNQNVGTAVRQGRASAWSPGIAAREARQASVPGFKPARASRIKRFGAMAKRHPYAIGAAGAGIAYNAGRQNTGPGITTTNTTGMYGY